MQLRVFLDHQLVDEFPADHSHRLAAGDLLIFDHDPPIGEPVKRYPAGSWHGAGALLCAGLPANADSCATCAPRPEASPAG